MKVLRDFFLFLFSQRKHKPWINLKLYLNLSIKPCLKKLEKKILFTRNVLRYIKYAFNKKNVYKEQQEKALLNKMKWTGLIDNSGKFHSA